MTSSTDESRAASSSPRGTSNGTCASASVRFARTMRCAIVGSATRNARAISSVVRPPSRRSVSATRASVDSTGWHAMKTSRSRSSPMSSSIDRLRDRGDGVCLVAIRSRGRARRACVSDRACCGAGGRCRGASRSASATRPGCPGRRTCGHCSSAATSASCASSSARPTSRTMRASPAMSRADSMRQTASISRWMSAAVTAADQSISSGCLQDAVKPLEAERTVRPMCRVRVALTRAARDLSRKRER